MWVSGIIGMATKYAEVLLAMRYRKRGADGAPVGGTMYCILLGMGKGAAPLAVLFAAFTLLASLGCGNMVQVNTIASAVTEAVRAVADPLSLDARLIAGITGTVMAAALGAVLLGGAKRVCSASAYVVPVMSALYIGAAVWVIARFSARLPEALRMIFTGAFGLRPAVGGAIGFSLSRVLRVGMTRGVFSNEAGIGAAPMAYASARCDDPVEQAMMGIFEVFVDTILICTLTALMVLVSGTPIPYGDAGASGHGRSPLKRSPRSCPCARRVCSSQSAWHCSRFPPCLAGRFTACARRSSCWAQRACAHTVSCSCSARSWVR